MFDLSLRSLRYATGVTLVSFGLAKLSVRALNDIKEDILDYHKNPSSYTTKKKVWEVAQVIFSLTVFFAGTVASFAANDCLSRHLLASGYNDRLVSTSAVALCFMGVMGSAAASLHSMGLKFSKEK